MWLPSAYEASLSGVTPWFTLDAVCVCVCVVFRLLDMLPCFPECISGINIVRM